MNEYASAFLFIILGLLGQFIHYLKKRYVDDTICCDLFCYVMHEKQRTFAAISTMITAEIALSANVESIGLNVIVGAITAGYTCDSGINKGPTK